MTVSGRRLAWSLWVTAVVLTAAGLVFLALNGSTETPNSIGSPVIDGVFAAFVLSFATVGALIAARQPRNPIGWLFLGGGLAAALEEPLLGWSTYALVTEPGITAASEDVLMDAYNRASEPGVRAIVLSFAGLDYMNATKARWARRSCAWTRSASGRSDQRVAQCSDPLDAVHDGRARARHEAPLQARRGCLTPLSSGPARTAWPRRSSWPARAGRCSCWRARRRRAAAAARSS